MDIGAEQLPSKDDLETYRIFFELFDRDSSGSIDAQDMAAIAFKLNRDPEEGKQLHFVHTCSVFGLIKGFDANNDSKISFGEFVSSLWTLERRDDELEMA